MRLNAMKKCAVGAMLVGGVLGASQDASASVTWLTGFAQWQSQNGAATFIPSVHPTYYHISVGASSLLNQSGSYLGLGSSSFSATTPTGFSVNLSHNGQFSGRFFTQAVRLFEVTGTLDLSLFLTRPGSGHIQYTLAKLNPTEVIASGATITNPLTWSGTLTAGTYSLAIELQTDTAASAFSGQVASVVVPAPGAFALLGAAGLVGKRRRR